MANNNQRVKKRVDRYLYHTEDIIGKGQFGYVYKGEHCETGEMLAIKVIPLQMLENSYLEYLLVNEIEALKKLRSPYIVKFIDMKLTTNNLYLITEFCEGGDLSSYLTKKTKVPEEEVIDVLYQICEAFKEMKRFSMLHRDLKPANILLNGGVVKIADLGFSKSVDNFANSMNRSTVGSPMYMSPQVLFHEAYTSKCDVWSLGIVLYQLLYGHVPFLANNVNELTMMIKSGRLNFPADTHISTELKDLLMRCLRYEERDRLSWDDVFAHAAVKKSKLANQPIQPAVPTEHTKSTSKMITEEEGKNSKDKHQKEGDTNNYHTSGRENSLPPKHSKPVARQSRQNNNATSNSKQVKEQKRDDSLQKRGRMQEEVVVSSNQQTTTGSNASDPAQQQPVPQQQQSRTGHRSSSIEHPIPHHFFGYGPPPSGYPPEMFPGHAGHYPPRGYAPPMPWMNHHHGHHPSGEDYQGGNKPYHPYPDFGGRMAYPPRPPLGNFYGENYQSSRGNNHGWQGDR